MTFNMMKLIRSEDNPERFSLKKVTSFIGLITLTLILIYLTYKQEVEPILFIYYPLGCTIFYSPHLAITLLNAWKGNKTTEAKGINNDKNLKDRIYD